MGTFYSMHSLKKKPKQKIHDNMFRQLALPLVKKMTH